MSKIELNTSISDGGFSQVNNNFQLIEDELNQKVLYRDNPVGEPNTLENSIDANNNDIFGIKDLRVDNQIYLNGLSIDQAIDAAAGGLVGDAEAAASAAAASAILAGSSATASANSAIDAANSFDSFDDRYLGAKNSPPTLDNDGNPLQLGALYWDNVLPPGGTFPATAVTFAPAGNISATLVQSAIQELDTEKAPIDSPTFTGDPKAPTPATADNDTSIATTAYVVAKQQAPSTIGSVTPNTGAFTTLSSTGTFTPSQTNGIVGTTTNNNANAGSFGEYLTANTTATAATSGVALNATSISLTAGDWDVTGIMQTNPAGTTTTTFWTAGISTTSATFDTVAAGINNYAIININATPAGAAQNMVAPTTRISVASTTTVYLVASVQFAVSTLTVSGFIRARRVR